MNRWGFRMRTTPWTAAWLVASAATGFTVGAATDPLENVPTTQPSDTAAAPADLPGETADEVTPGGQLTLDLGYTRPGQTRTAKLTLRNTTDQPVIYLHVEAECECTAIEGLPGVLEAGASQELTLTFDAPNIVSPYAKSLRLVADGNVTLDAHVKVKARIGQPLDVQPDKLELGTLKSGTTTSQELTIRNDGNTPIKLLYATSDHASVIARIARVTVEPGGTTRLPVEVTPAHDNPNPVTARLTIHTTATAQPTIQVMVQYLTEDVAK